jgi:hypothetical protein
MNPGFLAENEILSPVTPEAQRNARLNKLLKDERVHFDNHVVKGKIVKMEKDCSFCAAYYDQLNKRAEQIKLESGIRDE